MLTEDDLEAAEAAVVEQAEAVRQLKATGLTNTVGGVGGWLLGWVCVCVCVCVCETPRAVRRERRRWAGMLGAFMPMARAFPRAPFQQRYGTAAWPDAVGGKAGSASGLCTLWEESGP